jgi:ABC-type maltose transport system permease subunit
MIIIIIIIIIIVIMMDIIIISSTSSSPSPSSSSSSSLLPRQMTYFDRYGMERVEAVGMVTADQAGESFPLFLFFITIIIIIIIIDIIDIIIVSSTSSSPSSSSSSSSLLPRQMTYFDRYGMERVEAVGMVTADQARESLPSVAHTLRLMMEDNQPACVEASGPTYPFSARFSVSY